MHDAAFSIDLSTGKLAYSYFALLLIVFAPINKARCSHRKDERKNHCLTETSHVTFVPISLVSAFLLDSGHKRNKNQTKERFHLAWPGRKTLLSNKKINK